MEQSLTTLNKTKEKEEKKKPSSKLSTKLAWTYFLSQLVVSLIVAVLEVIIVGKYSEQEKTFEIINYLLIIICLIVFSYPFYKIVTARIFKLKDAAKEIADGNLGLNIRVEGQDEISGLMDSFNKMSDELKANEYLNKGFIENISSGFKAPLNAIKSYGELLEDKAKSEKIDKIFLKEYSEKIIFESDRLVLLSKNILQLSILESTVIIQKDEVVNSAEQIRNILRLTQSKWLEKKLTLDLNLEEFSLNNNSRLLYLVWQNLIDNAIKFSKVGGKITVILKKAEDNLFFEISDNGVGIKEEFKDKIFNRFFTMDFGNGYGSGLGLTIVKKILSKLNGEIGFESKENIGSRFYVKIPV